MPILVPRPPFHSRFQYMTLEMGQTRHKIQSLYGKKSEILRQITSVKFEICANC